MTYEEAAAYISDAAKYKISLGLDSIRSLLHYLGDPQEALQFIHIAGTNGKGSVLSYLSSILTCAGYTTGSYSSPAVVYYREKIRVNRRMISEDAFADVMGRVAEAAEQMTKDGKKHPTQFELETAAAVLYFKEQSCDYVVWETGLGGRLDATNVVENVPVSILTSISMDHRKFLGNTLQEIAEEKAGIIKHGMDVVCLYQQSDVNEVFQKKAAEEEAVLYPVDVQDIVISRESFRGQIFTYRDYPNLEIQMAGTVQPTNAALAVRAVEVLKKHGAVISKEAVYQGVRSVRWPGRFQIISENPLIIADGAHNPDAVRRLAESVEKYFPERKLICVMGVFADKDYIQMASIMGPLSEMMIAVTPPVPDRALPAKELCKCLQKYCGHAEAAGSLEEAMERAIEKVRQNSEEGVILAFGSLSYMGSLLQLMREEEGNRK